MNKGNLLFFFLLGLLNSYSIFSQNVEFIYKKVPLNVIYEKNVDIIEKEYVKIEDYLPIGHTVDGDVDYTTIIQKVLDSHRMVSFPDFPLLINDIGLKIHSNSKLLFSQNSHLILKASNKPQYGILNINDVSNIEIYNPNLKGDRYSHNGIVGEWGMGIRIVGSTNIKIFNPYIYDCWGDGIYIGSSFIKCSNDIKIFGGHIDNNRRNGISVVSASNLLLQNIVVSNTNGTLPMAGVDIEPNNDSDCLDTVILDNIISYNNFNDGFLVYLGGFLGSKKKIVNIFFDTCMDYFSNNAISIPGLRNDYSEITEKLDGEVFIKNFLSYDSENFFKNSSGNYQFTPKLSISNLKAFKDVKLKEYELKDFYEWFTRRSSRNTIKF